MLTGILPDRNQMKFLQYRFSDSNFLGVTCMLKISVVDSKHVGDADVMFRRNI